MSTPPASTAATQATPDPESPMNASIVRLPPDPDRSTLLGPPLRSTSPISKRAPPVPSSGIDVVSSGGPLFSLARCVGDVETFASQYWGRRPLVTTSSQRGSECEADRFADVLSLRGVDEFLANAARLPTVRMVADGSPLASTQFCSPIRLGGRQLDDVVDPVKVVARLAEGATLVLQSLHRTLSSVAEFVTQLQDEISHPVQANAYLTPPAAAGLAEHADLHDVLALQLHGCKTWWVEGLGDVTMRPGDVMYVPRGARHCAETATETSLHLTIGIIRVTRRQVIERVLRAGPASLDAPLPLGYRHRSRRDQLEQSLDVALEDVLDLMGSTDLSTLVEREQSRRLPRPAQAGRLTSILHVDELDVDAVIRWVAPETLALAVDGGSERLGHRDVPHGHDHSSPQPGRFTVHVGDRTLTLPTTALDALRALSGGHPVRVGDLPGLDEPSRVVLAKRLVREAACVIDGLR